MSVLVSRFLISALPFFSPVSVHLYLPFLNPLDKLDFNSINLTIFSSAYFQFASKIILRALVDCVS